MLIGIDASRAAVERRTGTENYSLHLIRGLLDQGRGHRFRLYFNQAPAEDLFPAAAERRLIPLRRLWTHLRLSSELLQHPPDLLFVPSHVLPLVHPKRCVVTIHDLGFQYYPQAHTLSQNLYLRWSTRHNARAATRLLVDSEATRQDLVRYYGTPESKIVVVYPGRDESLAPVTDPSELSTIRARYGISADYFLYVGTLHPRKNLVRLVQAFGAFTQNTSSDLQLVLAGRKGWLYDDIWAQVRKLSLTERIVFTGYVPAEDLPALLSGARAFVYPSLYEGFGLPVLEAMACGTPVICSNVSSLPEVAGDAAILIEPLDVESISAALTSTAVDDALCRELVTRGFKQKEHFSWRRCAQETLEVLEDVGRGLD
jgi:glycosyltransferase involved in cell wall biosynthesis